MKGSAGKAQVSMEYLVTYAWAFIALLVVVALLFSSNFLASFKPQDSCTFTPDYPCYSFVSYKNPAGKNVLTLNVTNGFGYPIKIRNVSLSKQGGQTIAATVVEPNLLPKIIDSNGRIDLKLTYEDNATDAGDPIEVYVSMAYANCAPQVLAAISSSATCASVTDYPHVLKGRIDTILSG